MFVIRLPNGNLQVPQTAIHTGDGRIIGDVYVEIGPQDPDYDRLAAQAITPDEAAQRKDQWRGGDAALLREFQEFARLVGDQYWPGEGAAAGEESRRARRSGRRARPPGAVPQDRCPARSPGYDAAGCPSGETSLSP